MAEAKTRYVKKPGGVILHMADGTSENFAYGARVTVADLAEHQQENIGDFTDTKKKSETPDEAEALQAVRVANQNAALADSGQPNSTSSPVPGNYHELDADGAVVLFQTLDQFPGVQAALYIHEKLNLGREKVLDAATDAARDAAEAQLGQVKEQLQAEHEVVSRDESTREGGEETEVHTVVPPGTDATVEAPGTQDSPQTPPPTS